MPRGAVVTIGIGVVEAEVAAVVVRVALVVVVSPRLQSSFGGINMQRQFARS